MSKQTDSHYTWDLIYLLFKCFGIMDLQTMYVQDLAVVISDHTFAIDRVSAQFFQFTCNIFTSQRDHFYRQWELT